ncbi:hypothetical protein O988_01308 [Pseudogymnoascus sp. VKM F-3808]|nr:hypothetical protein O988_01308 [Pseudogymnoascus sp. VKM F-3808]
MGESIWTYDPNFPVSIVFAAFYAIPLFVQTYQTFIRYRSYYFWVVFAGALLEVGGYAARTVAIKHLDQIPPYAVQSSLVIIAPIFIGAGDYMLVSRLCLAVLPSHLIRIYGFSTRKLTRIFISADIISFLIQVSGSGIASSGNWEGSNATLGQNVLIAGLATQLLTFLFFVGILRRFHQLANTEGREDAPRGWRKVLHAVYATSALVIVRCIYRLIEFALGIDGYPFVHEWMFYVLESLPMLVAIIIFCVYHPAKYLPNKITEKMGDDTQLESRLVSKA